MDDKLISYHRQWQEPTGDYQVLFLQAKDYYVRKKCLTTSYFNNDKSNTRKYSKPTSNNTWESVLRYCVLNAWHKITLDEMTVLILLWKQPN